PCATTCRKRSASCTPPIEWRPIGWLGRRDGCERAPPRAGVARGARALPRPRQPIGRANELVPVAGLQRRGARIPSDPQRGFRPGAMQVPGAFHRAYHVIAPLHDDGWNMPDPADILDELVVAAQEAAMHEVVAFDARERGRIGALVELRHVARIQAQET